MRILCKYPTRSRPELFKQTLERWQSFQSGKHSVRWVVSADVDDRTMNTEEMKTYCLARRVDIYFGNSSTKIEAINADMEKAGDWDILVLVSDDITLSFLFQT